MPRTRTQVGSLYVVRVCRECCVLRSKSDFDVSPYPGALFSGVLYVLDGTEQTPEQEREVPPTQGSCGDELPLLEEQKGQCGDQTQQTPIEPPSLTLMDPAPQLRGLRGWEQSHDSSDSAASQQQPHDSNVRLAPTPGSIVVFPSWLSHYVPPAAASAASASSTDGAASPALGPRMSIAFNVHAVQTHAPAGSGRLSVRVPATHQVTGAPEPRL